MQLQTVPQPPVLDATCPSSVVEPTRYTENKQKGKEKLLFCLYEQTSACLFMSHPINLLRVQ